MDALGELDDCLSMVHLFAALPAAETNKINVECIHKCRRYTLEIFPLSQMREYGIVQSCTSIFGQVSKKIYNFLCCYLSLSIVFIPFAFVW